MNQIDRQLTVASIDELVNNPTHDYDTIISVCQDCSEDNVSDFTTYEQYPLADGCDSQRNWGGSYDYQTFQNAVNAVVQALFDGSRVLLHCHKGRNRSVSVAIAVYAIWRDTSYTSAKVTVRQGIDKKRPDDELLAFARHCIGNNIRGSPL